MNHVQAMEREITKRRQVIELLGQGKKYYDRWRKFWRLVKKSFRRQLYFQSVWGGRDRRHCLQQFWSEGEKGKKKSEKSAVTNSLKCRHVFTNLPPRWRWSWRRRARSWAAAPALCQVLIMMPPPRRDQVITNQTEELHNKIYINAVMTHLCFHLAE